MFWLALTAVTLASYDRLADYHVDHFLDHVDIGHEDVPEFVGVRMRRVKDHLEIPGVLLDVGHFHVHQFPVHFRTPAARASL